jgi:flagellin FlaB
MGRNTTAGGSIGDGMWGIVAIRNDAGGSNWLLEKGEQFDIGARPSMLIYKNDAFNIEVKPATGSPLDIKRTAPAALQTINILY